MEAGAIDRLRVMPHEEVTAAHLSRLETLIARQTVLRGPNVFRRQFPWGTITRYRAPAAGAVSPIFCPMVSKNGSSYSITWQPGTVQSVVPQVNGTPLMDGTGKPLFPQFTFDSGSFGPMGWALIYWQCTIGPDWFISAATPLASPTVPASKPWTAYRLAALVYADGTYWRPLYLNQGFMAINQTTAGVFTPLWWPLS